MNRNVAIAFSPLILVFLTSCAVIVNNLSTDTEQASIVESKLGLGVGFLEIKEAFALAGYDPIICTFPENHDKYECQNEDTIALYRAPNKWVEVMFNGYVDDLHTVVVGFNIDAASHDNTIINEFVGAVILIAEHIVPQWDKGDRTQYFNSTMKTLTTDQTGEIMIEHVGHLRIRLTVNSRNWMAIAFERDSEVEISYERKEPSLQVAWTDIKNSYALEGFMSQICLDFTEVKFPLCHADTTAVQVHESKGYVTYSGRLSELRKVGVFTDFNASIDEIKKIQTIAIQNIIPESPELDDWMDQAISTIKQNPEAVLNTQIGDKEIKMSGIKLKQTIFLQIEAVKEVQ